MKMINQVIITDTSTAEYKPIEYWEDVNFDKFPIPHEGAIIGICNKEHKSVVNYKVKEITYVYKHDKNTISYVYIYVTHV